MKCKICEKKDTEQFAIIEPHHVVPEWFKKKTKMIILCRQCHAKIHAFYHKEALRIAFKKDKGFFNKCFRKFKNANI